jgi:hypothetical protein
MKHEIPAKGITLTGKWPDAVAYRVECECSDPDHAAVVWMEVNGDPEIKNVDLSFYVNTTTPFWSMSRWQAIWNLLTHGHHQGQHTLLLDSQSAINLAAAIQDTVKKLEANSNTTSKL